MEHVHDPESTGWLSAFLDLKGRRLASVWISARVSQFIDVRSGCARMAAADAAPLGGRYRHRG